MELIGKGTFSKVYLKSKSKVIIKSTCPIKECIANGWFPKTALFPTLKRLGYQEYECRYYPKVTSLKTALEPDQYVLYKELKRLSHTEYRADVAAWYKVFPKITNRRIRQHLQDAVEACANYGSDVMFEISPRNVAVHNGKLVLLDVFFIKSHLTRVKSLRK